MSSFVTGVHTLTSFSQSCSINSCSNDSFFYQNMNHNNNNNNNKNNDNNNNDKGQNKNSNSNNITKRNLSPNNSSKDNRKTMNHTPTTTTTNSHNGSSSNNSESVLIKFNSKNKTFISNTDLMECSICWKIVHVQCMRLKLLQLQQLRIEQTIDKYLKLEKLPAAGEAKIVSKQLKQIQASSLHTSTTTTTIPPNHNLLHNSQAILPSQDSLYQQSGQQQQQQQQKLQQQQQQQQQQHQQQKVWDCVVNEELPNSWECPLCCEAGKSGQKKVCASIHAVEAASISTYINIPVFKFL